MGLCQSNRNSRKSFAAKKLHTQSDTNIQSKSKGKETPIRPKTQPTLNTIVKDHFSTIKTPIAIGTSKRMFKEALAKTYSVLNQDFGYPNNDNIGLIQHNVTGQVRTAKTILKEDESINDMDQYINNIRENNLVILFILQKSSPHFNNAIELFQDFKCYYVIQQYCSGGKLNNLCGKIEEDNAIYIISQILDTLKEIHNLNNYHGNLSIQSFALQDQSNNHYVKLIDIYPVFQVKDKQDVQRNQLNDMKAVGLILFQLLTNKQITKQTTEMILKKPKDLSYRNSFWFLLVIQFLELKNLSIYDNLQQNSNYQKIIKKYQSQYAESIFSKIQVKKASYLQQQIILVMNKMFFQERQNQIQRVFLKNDTNHNGTLQKEELKNALGYEEDIDEIFDQIDIDGNGKIDMNEFIFTSCDRAALLNEFNLNIAFYELQRKGFVVTSQFSKYISCDEDKIENEIASKFNQKKLNKQDFIKLMMELL
ncbi:unnamed protein product (macronuclear) [Paramecium tetraurelia]|uniref:Protein kinase domain-containing protein n=1 Tax=Paramecium tetraurelia TaxID=5888 RepID=A0C4D5_PARTE|nr:uncharacterized protein GSPATT00035132001 [Paramecium tetraurelia]CAK65652.1 unnamed protein product [Paramecium tetraurelia]|eukprot:XP_001433049.1 hypothetical protein (macronuclear) [Paramecium tetraurelia strain d4-2]